MTRMLAAVVLLASTAVLPGAARGQSSAPPDGPGWTGLTNPEDVILARQAMMAELERLMRPVDSLAAGEAEDADEVRSAAVTISRILPVVPHLFPPTTNRYNAADEAPATIALPAIWETFPAFYELAAAATAAAGSMTSASDADALAAGAQRLRASCDACHAVYLRPYTPAGVSDEDTEFDFDSLFEEGQPAPQ